MTHTKGVVSSSYVKCSEWANPERPEVDGGCCESRERKCAERDCSGRMRFPLGARGRFWDRTTWMFAHRCDHPEALSLLRGRPAHALPRAEEQPENCVVLFVFIVTLESKVPIALVKIIGILHTDLAVCEPFCPNCLWVMVLWVPIMGNQ